jgi:hypothetical protein
MTHGALHVSAIALGVAAFVSVSVLPLSTASADPPAPDTATPPLSEPAPTPGILPSPLGETASAPREAAGAEPMPPERPASHVYGGHYVRHTHYAWRHGHRYDTYSRDPVRTAANVVAGGIADLGSIAAYPFYCFPRYGSCPFYRPYP